MLSGNTTKTGYNSQGTPNSKHKFGSQPSRNRLHGNRNHARHHMQLSRVLVLVLSLLSITNAALCPAGKKCADGDNIDCSAGEYSFLGVDTCSLCLTAHECPHPADIPRLCPEGFYSKEGEQFCKQCPAGNECPLRSAFKACGDKTFSPLGQAYCSNCLAGYACKDKESMEKCPLGTYSAAGDATCTECPIGSFCPAVDLTAIICPVGFYNLDKN
jgi:hypothetical protein